MEENLVKTHVSQTAYQAAILVADCDHAFVLHSGNLHFTPGAGLRSADTHSHPHFHSHNYSYPKHYADALSHAYGYDHPNLHGTTYQHRDGHSHVNTDSITQPDHGTSYGYPAC